MEVVIPNVVWPNFVIVGRRLCASERMPFGMRVVEVWTAGFKNFYPKGSKPGGAPGKAAGESPKPGGGGSGGNGGGEKPESPQQAELNMRNNIGLALLLTAAYTVYSVFADNGGRRPQRRERHSKGRAAARYRA
ncbi:hypothetical protein MNEG_14462 [Monoraphidium neglectum]|uniref:Uncharacterized protein n=1 Tax=Monoraphidium neglectum TaxID=145388 RepID=A0A0D2KCB6_9CHLO|nr:hypothetical protein MNEG_14462 [Monoraphidium neglectum]KIY93498.1 hypothetical protein MNEG_14462 [Monoraphidium neglectum]|eukprot:XP_013892518.1 hypothetical protein MNEG_14462 [Monoraphidium neglectum]